MNGKGCDMAMTFGFGSLRRLELAPVPVRGSKPAVSVLLAALVAVSICWHSTAAQGATAGAASGISWVHAASDADVDKAFALGRQSGRPVFLYWGAIWCPPCNQVKATLFSRPDFVERSRAFVPVYVDGDKPGAQKIAARFKVQGYPTMILFKPDGTEVTRLPGEVGAQRYLLALTAGLNAKVPVKNLVRQALGKQTLTSEQWRLLAFYSWDTDEQQILTAAELPQRLYELASSVPAELAPERDRLALKALAASAGAGTATNAQSTTARPTRPLVDRLLADPGSVRQMADLLVGYAKSIVKYLEPQGNGKRALAGRWDSALARLMEGTSLSRADRVDALDARVAMWKMMEESEALSPERRAQVLGETARLVAATSDRFERQAVIPGAAHVLAHAGLLTESDELLKQELPRAVAPYYHMPILASNAKQRKDSKSALSWYEQAWSKSEGPATRIQWGTGLVGQLVELAPGDTARVETAATSVIAQLEVNSETFYERNQRSLQRMASRLTQWQGSDAARIRTVEHVKQKLEATCVQLPAGQIGRNNCDNVFPRSKI